MKQLIQIWWEMAPIAVAMTFAIFLIVHPASAIVVWLWMRITK